MTVLLIVVAMAIVADIVVRIIETIVNRRYILALNEYRYIARRIEKKYYTSEPEKIIIERN